MYLPEKGYKRVFVIVLYALLGVFCIKYGFKYMSIVLIPFGISWLVAYFLQKPVMFLKKKCHIPVKLSAIVLVVFTLTAVCTAVFFLSNKLISELSGLYRYSELNCEKIAQAASDTLEKLKNTVHKLPLPDFMEETDIGEKIGTALLGGIESIVSGAVGKIPSFLTAVINFVPKLFIFVIILIFSSCYLTIDFQKVNSFIRAQFNGGVEKFLVEFKTLLFDVAGKFVKAYILLFFVTFAVLLLAFVIMGLKFAFIIALTIAIIDLLPVLGSGTVLIPWSIVSLVLGNYSTAVELIVLYLALTFIRQMLLPRIMGDFVGLHPLVSLLSMFVGFAVMGFTGMFVFPLVLVILVIMNDRGTVHLWKNPEKEEKNT